MNVNTDNNFEIILEKSVISTISIVNSRSNLFIFSNIVIVYTLVYLCIYVYIDSYLNSLIPLIKFTDVICIDNCKVREHKQIRTGSVNLNMSR